MAADLNDLNDVWPRVAALDTTLAAKVYPVVRLALLDLEARLAALEAERGRASEGERPQFFEGVGPCDQCVTVKECEAAASCYLDRALDDRAPSPGPSGIGEEPKLEYARLYHEPGSGEALLAEDCVTSVLYLKAALTLKKLPDRNTVGFIINVLEASAAALRAGGRAERQRVIDAANRPQPTCRDCADVDGRCPNDGKLCDPFEAALETLRAVAETRESLCWRCMEMPTTTRVHMCEPCIAAVAAPVPVGWPDPAEPQVGLDERERHLFTAALLDDARRLAAGDVSRPRQEAIALRVEKAARLLRTAPSETGETRVEGWITYPEEPGGDIVFRQWSPAPGHSERAALLLAAPRGETERP